MRAVFAVQTMKANYQNRPNHENIDRRRRSHHRDDFRYH